MSRDLGREEGRVLQFRTATRRVRTRDEAGASERGTLLLFTGVRYERMVDDTLAGSAERTSSGGDRRLGA